MLAQERQQLILDMFKDRKIIKTAEIAEKFNVSNLTARRDFDELSNMNMVTRIYGGAMLVESPAMIHAGVIEDRKGIEQERIAMIHAIGKCAASLIEEGDVIFLGNGNVTLEIAKNLADTPNLTFIVSSIPIANYLLSINKIVYILGGMIDPYEHNTNGHIAMEMMRQFCPNKTFIGCDGMSVKHGVTAYNRLGADLGTVAVESAEKSFLVIDSRKIEKNAMNIVCPLSALTAVITDDHLPKEKRKTLESAGVKLYCAETNHEA